MIFADWLAYNSDCRSQPTINKKMTTQTLLTQEEIDYVRNGGLLEDKCDEVIKIVNENDDDRYDNAMYHLGLVKLYKLYPELYERVCRSLDEDYVYSVYDSLTIGMLKKMCKYVNFKMGRARMEQYPSIIQYARSVECDAELADSFPNIRHLKVSYQDSDSITTQTARKLSSLTLTDITINCDIKQSMKHLRYLKLTPYKYTHYVGIVCNKFPNLQIIDAPKCRIVLRNIQKETKIHTVHCHGYLFCPGASGEEFPPKLRKVYTNGSTRNMETIDYDSSDSFNSGSDISDIVYRDNRRVTTDEECPISPCEQIPLETTKRTHRNKHFRPRRERFVENVDTAILDVDSYYGRPESDSEDDEMERSRNFFIVDGDVYQYC